MNTLSILKMKLSIFFCTSKTSQKTAVFAISTILQTFLQTWRAKNCIIQPLFTCSFCKKFGKHYTWEMFHFWKRFCKKIKIIVVFDFFHAFFALLKSITFSRFYRYMSVFKYDFLTNFHHFWLEKTHFFSSKLTLYRTFYDW